MAGKKMSPQAAPEDVINQSCLLTRIRLLNRVVTRIYDDMLRPAGIKASQLSTLVAVAKWGPLAPGRVGERLQVEKSTLSRNVERLITQKWLEVVPGANARTHNLQITEEGRNILQESLVLWEKAQDKARSLLSDDGILYLQTTVASFMEKED